jgi:hypothetical protein
MLPFCKWGPINGSERKALLVAILCSSGFIILFAIVNRPLAHGTRKRIANERRFPPPSRLTEAPPPPLDPLAPFRIVPMNFNHVDFNNYSYGLYTASVGKRIKLTLDNGRLDLADGSGWFALQDVYYKDLTGDSKAEAIVRLSHVRCGVPCDAGADLFYIYTEHNGKLEAIWQYETGSYECSLKSFTVADKQLVLELFGRCPSQAMENSESSSVPPIEDLTYVLILFDGQRFKQQSVDFFHTLPHNPKSNKPLIRIF